MPKHLFSLMAFFFLSGTFSIISSQRELPAYVKKHLNAQGQYACRDLTPEEIAQMNARGKEEWGQEGLAQFNILSRQEVLEIFNKSVKEEFLDPQVAEPTIAVIPGAHAHAVASYHAIKRVQIQNSYATQRNTYIKKYDRLAKGSLLISGSMLALYAVQRFNLFSIANFDRRYFGAGCLFGLAGSYYAYSKKQTMVSMPMQLSDQKIDELLEKFKKTQEQTIKDVCHLQ